MSPYNSMSTAQAYAESGTEDRLTPTEEATVNAIEADFAELFERWEARGFPRTVVIPMALFFIVDLAKRTGVTFKRAVDTMHLIWHGKDPD